MQTPDTAYEHATTPRHDSATTVDDATLLSELEQLAGGAGDESAAAEQAADPIAEDPQAASEEQVAAPGEEQGAGDESPATGQATDPPAEDQELQRRLTAIQAEEKRAKASIAAELERLEKLRAEITAREAEQAAAGKTAAGLDDLRARVLYDPASVLRELGVGDGDLEAASRQIYAMSEAGQRDPRLRQVAADALRSRGALSEIAAVKRQIDDVRAENAKLREEMQAAARAREDEQRAHEYITQATKAVGDDTPIVRAMLERTPDKARALIEHTAMRLIQELGEVPTHRAVIAEIEKTRRAELSELGIDPSLVGKTSASVPTPAVQAATKKAPTIDSQLGTTTRPRTEPISEEDLDADILRGMAEL